jgi:hypothetical protein
MTVYIIIWFLHPWKKCLDMLSEGTAAHPVECDSPAWRPFCLSSNFLGRVWQPSAENNGAPKVHYYLQRAVTPDQITQQNTVVCRGQERPKIRKDTLRPDFQSNTRPRIFFKKPMSPQDPERQLWGNQAYSGRGKFMPRRKFMPQHLYKLF